MMKFVVLSVFLFIALCNAGGHGGHGEEHYAPAQYKFSYGVSDPHTGDKKQQWEHRDGDVVKGAYSLHEPDGTIRVVEYTSDKKNGFNAVVKRVGHAQHPQVYGHGGHGHGGGHGGSGGHGGHGGHGGQGGESYVGATHWGHGGHGGHH